MTPKDILKYIIAVPPAQFPLIAHFVKWLTASDDTELSPGFMILDGVQYKDGIVMSYMMQVHDILMMKPIEALIAANMEFAGEEVQMWIRVENKVAMLWFTKEK